MRTYRRPSTCRFMTVPSSVIARQAFMNSSRARAVNRGSRSTPRIACTARLAISRTRPRTSTGSRPKAAEDPIIRTCKWLAGASLAALALSPASASARLTVSDPARTYIQARAASMRGDHAGAAQMLATLAGAEPGQAEIGKKALTEAIGAGQMDRALNLTRTVSTAGLPSDARLLLVAAEIKRGHPERAIPWLKVSDDTADLSFLAPLINAWGAADRGNADQAIAAIDQMGPTSLLGPLADEERAFILLKFRRAAEAEAP